MSAPQTEPPEPEIDRPAPPADAEGVFRMNLEAFGERADRLCRLTRSGRLSADSCFVALTQLWIQLAHSHRRLGARHAPPDTAHARLAEAETADSHLPTGTLDPAEPDRT